MGNLPRLPRIRLLIGGLLILFGVLAVPKFASSEADPSAKATGFQAGRYAFVSTGPIVFSQVTNGFRITLTSITYAHDPATGAYATLPATPARPVVVQDIDGVVSFEGIDRR